LGQICARIKTAQQRGRAGGQYGASAQARRKHSFSVLVSGTNFEGKSGRQRNVTQCLVGGAVPKIGDQPAQFKDHLPTGPARSTPACCV
jgi:hypothetical protein